VVIVLARLARRARATALDAPGPARAHILDAAVFLAAGLSGAAFIALTVLWSNGGDVSARDFAGDVVLLAVIVVATTARRLLSARQAIRMEARAQREADGFHFEPPVPSSWRVRPPARGHLVDVAVRTTPRLATSVPAIAESEIEWSVGAKGSVFRLRDSGVTPETPDDEESPEVTWDADGPPSRTEEASRAHAILYDRLVLSGWEPDGQGPAWYAHRFRRGTQ
jgi:hypothetical protein